MNFKNFMNRAADAVGDVASGAHNAIRPMSQPINQEKVRRQRNLESRLINAPVDVQRTMNNPAHYGEYYAPKPFTDNYPFINQQLVRWKEPGYLTNAPWLRLYPGEPLPPRGYEGTM